MFARCINILHLRTFRLHSRNVLFFQLSISSFLYIIAMDFHSLSRRDLQFFCKKNKIPANMTNIAMADALKALEIVEGIDEYANLESARDQSPTSIARTAARTTRRKATKDETQASELVTRSCFVTSKSLSGEMDLENKNTNMLQNPSVPQSSRRAAATSVAVKLDINDEANVSKTPAVRSTRRAQAIASSKKDESVQRVYSTRRSVRLLEESMADLCLKTTEYLNVPVEKYEDAEREDSPAGSKIKAKSDENSENTDKAEVMSVRDLNGSLEKESDESKNEPAPDSASDSFVIVNEQETSQEDDVVVVDHDASSTTITNTVACNNESESDEQKTIDSESESEAEQMEYETDLKEGNDFGGAGDTKQEGFESTVSADMVDSVTTVVVADESKELEGDSDEWSDFEIDDIELEDKSCGSESEEAPVSNKKKTPASSSSESKTPLSPSETESILESNKNKENVVEMAPNNSGEGEAEAKKKTKKKKKIIDEESFKDVSMRQLTKLVKELAIKSRQQQESTA